MWINCSSIFQYCVQLVTSVLFPCLYAALFLVAFVLNSLAAWIFFQIRSTSTFVVYLKNVVVADLLMTLTVPVKALTDAGLGSWQLRAFHCRYSAVLFYTTMYISILLLGLISLDRYLKIVHPFGKCALQRVSVGRILCAVVWVVMLSLALPNVILSNHMPQISSGAKLRCTKMKGKMGLLWHEGFNYFCQVVFWGTLALMVVCYTFISRKVFESVLTNAKLSSPPQVFVVVGVFFVCFAPFHLARVPYTLSQTQITLWISSTNVCLDPLIYVFLCRVFRRKLTAALSRHPLPHASLTETSTKIEMPNRPLTLTATPTRI
uniref:P2Y purinoceptor 13-like n=1 Tax=Sinocyclocheilus rhinocerous TaxID=307959 RepID=A0A673GF90_9TELE